MTTKEKILFSALELFADQGIDKTSTAAIAKHAGVASGTVFVHFCTKKKLIQELYLHMKEDIMKQLAQVIEQVSSAQSVEQTCHTLFFHVIQYLLTEPRKFAFVQQVEHNPAHEVCFIKEKKDAISEFFCKAIEQKHIRKTEIELLQKVIWSLIEAIVSFYQKNNITEVQKEHLDIIYSAIQHKQ